MHIRIFLEFLEKYKCLCIDFSPQGSRCVFNEQPCLKFKLWCQRRLLRVPWTARISNQWILKEINPEYSLKDWYWSWISNRLATYCEEPTHWKRPWCWERFTVGGEGGDRGWDSWMASLTQWTWVRASSRRW